MLRMVHRTRLSAIYMLLLLYEEVKLNLTKLVSSEGPQHQKYSSTKTVDLLVSGIISIVYVTPRNLRSSNVMES